MNSATLRVSLIAAVFIAVFFISALSFAQVGDSSIVTQKDQLSAPMPSDAKVNSIIMLAHSLSEKDLLGSGPYTCRYAFSGGVFNDPAFFAQGDSYDFAHARVGLQCIKHRCGQLDSVVRNAGISDAHISDSDMRDYMRTQGYTADQIENAIQNRKAPQSAREKVTCENATQTSRHIVYMGCFIAPIECMKVK